MREGNLQQYAHGTSNSAIASTIMPDKGKWYVELYLESQVVVTILSGITDKEV